MNRCVIIGAAPMADPLWICSRLRAGDWVLAADGGYQSARAAGITPALLVADFDSFPGGRAAVLPDTEVAVLPTHKDQTDTLAAVEIAYSRGFREYLLLGCLGGRLDHTIANIQVMASLTARGCRVTLQDERNRVTLWEPGEHELPFEENGGFSLLAYDPQVTGVTIRQAAYPLTNAVLTSDFPLGVSNAFLPGQPALISIKTGRLLVFCSKD